MLQREQFRTIPPRCELCGEVIGVYEPLISRRPSARTLSRPMPFAYQSSTVNETSDAIENRASHTNPTRSTARRSVALNSNARAPGLLNISPVWVMTTCRGAGAPAGTARSR
jgi:hypothetical protein